MKTIELFKVLNGMHTIESIMDTLHVNKQMAVYYIHRLRKEGYVKTIYGHNKKRVYKISIENKLGGTSYTDILNKNSPIKIATSEKYVIYGKTLSIEETIIYALKTKSVRKILSAIALFKKISDWKLLYTLAKKEGLKRQVGALYDVAKTITRVKAITKRFRNNTLPTKKDKYQDIIPYMKSRDFQHIEKKWKVHIPFNIADFEDYT